MEKSDYLISFIKNALDEDIGNGDHTSEACVGAESIGKARLLVKDEGILAGVEVALLVYQVFDPGLKTEVFISDGTQIKKGDVVFTVEGYNRSILQTERLVLNIMQRMSGIATQTSKYAERIKDLKTCVVDTRKTTPGMRILEKMAVKLGGGENHRMGLYDMILIKDNHVDFAGGIAKAIKKTQEYLRQQSKALDIEIEVRNFEELQQVLECGGVNRIMLDNFNVPDTRKAVEIIGNRYQVESSGGITLENLREYALSGVDYISVGALTHHVKSLDLSLKAMK